MDEQLPVASPSVDTVSKNSPTPIILAVLGLVVLVGGYFLAQHLGLFSHADYLTQIEEDFNANNLEGALEKADAAIQRNGDDAAAYSPSRSRSRRREASSSKKASMALRPLLQQRRLSHSSHPRARRIAPWAMRTRYSRSTRRHTQPTSSRSTLTRRTPSRSSVKAM